MTVTLDAAVERFASRLAAVPAKARRAMAEGLNEGGDLERTQVRRALKHQTGVSKAGAITRRTSSKRAGPGSLEYVIRGSGRGMPIREFPVSVGAHITARPWGVSHDFGARSFRSKVKGLLRRRVGGPRLPIEAFNGPSVAKEIVKDETAAEFSANAGPRVERAVIKRLGRLLP